METKDAIAEVKLNAKMMHQQITILTAHAQHARNIKWRKVKQIAIRRGRCNNNRRWGNLPVWVNSPSVETIRSTEGRILVVKNEY
ncbi:MAG: hypothetical protein ACTS6A_00975 [Candidatus Hodgkinia cicadicola]